MKNSMREKMQSSSLSSSFPDNNNDYDGDGNNHNRNELRNEDNNFTLYKLSKYLRMPRKLLVHSLQLHFNYYGLKRKKKERCFLLTRLKLFDRQFYLDQIRHLYQFYFDQGLKHQIWLVSFRVI